VNAPSQRLPLTVLIPTYNEERNLPDCLASVAWADEILVVDSFSGDRTVAIATAAGARVVQHVYVNSAAQKNWAIPQCSHRWVLVVDADERVDAALAEAIRATLARAGGPEAAAYTIRRRTFAFGAEIRHSGWQGDSVRRLFDRARCRYPDLEVHADLSVDGPVGLLDGRLDHYTYRTFDEYFEKFRRYTTWSANDRWKRGDRASFLTVAIKPLSRFLRSWVLRRGFLDGTPGLIVCLLGAISAFTREAKLWAMQRAVERGQRWADGELIVHAGAAVHERQEVIAGGRRGVVDGKAHEPA
jgi:glycosyltransferase involved in cell wall biosynthesis